MVDAQAKAREIQVAYLQYSAAVVAALVAGIHLLHPRLGAPRLIQHVLIGTFFDPRPIAFTLSAILIVIGIVLVFNGILVRPVYLFGMGLMLTYLLGYASWHAFLGHGAFWPYITAHGHTDLGAIAVVWIHLVDDPIAMVSKTFEIVLFVLLAVLYRLDVSETSRSF